MLEKISILVLSPILIYGFGLFLPEYMIDRIDVVINDYWMYALIPFFFCWKFIFRRKDLEASHFIFCNAIFISAGIIAGVCIGAISGSSAKYHMGKLLIGILCSFYLTYFARKTSSAEKISQLRKSHLIYYCVGALLVAVVTIYPINSYIRSRAENPVIIFFAFSLFTTGILYPLGILFSIYCKDKQLLEYTRSKE